MELRNPLRTTAVLFDGQWTLPEPVLTARNALTRVQGIVEGLPPHPPEHPHTVRDRLAYLVATGADIDPAPVFDAQRAIEDYEERVNLARRAQEIAAQQFSAVLGGHARGIIVDHLGPAFGDLVGKLGPDLAATSHIDGQSPPAVVLSQPKPVRDALIRIDTNVSRYRLIRQAHDLLRRLAGAESQDARGYFFEVKNCEEVWPAITGTGFAPRTPPWPTDGDTRARLAWLFANGAQLWLPTAEEQTDRYLEVFGERIEQVRANRSYLNAYRQMHSRTGGDTGGESTATGSRQDKRAALADRLLGVPVNGGADL